MFTAFVAKPPRFVTIGATRGVEHVTSADTLDLEYGRLLDRVASDGKVVASPTGYAPFRLIGRVAA